MRKKILERSEWQDISVEFFLEEVFPRFLNKTNKLSEMVIEAQYFPSLACGFNNDRIFISPKITIDFPYSKRMEKLKSDLLNEGNFEALRNFEENHLLGFVMTVTSNEPDYKIDCVTFSKATIFLFLQNLGVNYKEGDPLIAFWYNPKKDGRADMDLKVIEKVTPNRRMRVRYLDFKYFMRIMENFKENNYRYPYDFIKDDYEP